MQVIRSYFALALGLGAGSLNAQLAYLPPEGGWDYLYQGDEAHYAAAGEGFASFDGTWSHDNGSDAWDGSAIGGNFGSGNRPGGVQVITEDGLDYLRIQDTGDPRDHGFTSDPSNRKIYLIHDLADEGAGGSVLDDGVTLIFRARVPTDGPLDPLYADGQGESLPYPKAGDGYVTANGGKGQFVIRQADGGAVAFSLNTATDTPFGDPDDLVAGTAGLNFNEFDGNALSENVNFGQGKGANVLLLDPTEWHEFWIVIEADASQVGTHVISIYVDGEKTPQVFKVTAGTGSDFGGSYLALGSTATPQSSALDIDFFGVKLGAVVPSGASEIPPPEIDELRPELGTNYAAAGEGVSFTVRSPGAVSREQIRIVLNGRDRSAELQLTGDEGNWNANLSGLTANWRYEGTVTVTDTEGTTLVRPLAFSTFREDNRTVEAENFNFDQGKYIDRPEIDGGDSYFDKGTGSDSADVDYHKIGPFIFENEDAWRYPAGDHDMPNTDPNDNEAGRSQYDDYPELDFSVYDTQPGEWLNYTREFRSGAAHVYLRATGSSPFEVELHRVTSPPNVPDQTTEKLGDFASDSIRGERYEWLPLVNETGAYVTLDLNGTTTLRLQISQGEPVLNFLMFVPAFEVPAPPDDTRLTVAPDRFGVTVTWEGTGRLIWTRELLHGVWRPALSARSPYFAVPHGRQLFFGVGTPTELTIVENKVTELVSRAVARYQEVGDVAYNEITFSGDYVEGEIYCFAVDSDAVIVAHAATPGLVGEPSIDWQDSTGAFFARDILRDASAEGIWRTYFFTNPLSGLEEPKRVWVKKAGSILFGSGYYLDIEELVQQQANRAVSRFREAGETAFEEITQSGEYSYGEIFSLAYDTQGVVLAHATRPELVGADHSDADDGSGLKYVQAILEAADADGEWIHYRDTNPVSGADELKRAWAVKTEETVFVSGHFP